MNIVIIHGFSSLKAEERLKLLVEKIVHELPISEQIPQLTIILLNYLESYGRFGKMKSGKKSITEYATICKSVIEKKEKPLFLIGYSLGGLITRVLIEKMEISVQAAILVGAPNKGIKLTCRERLLLKMLKKPAIEQMLPDSQFLQELNNNYHKLQKRYYLIAGDKDEKVSIYSALATETLQSQGTFTVPTDHAGLIPEKLKSTESSAIDIIIQILRQEAGF